MRNTALICLTGCLTALVALASTDAVAADQMYKCEDGTFTNVAERLCPPYEPQGTVLVMPAGATLASVRATLGEAAPKNRIPDPPGVCSLYQEWMALNLKTGGGVTFPTTQDVPRWLSLSRIFTAIGAPHCP
ncbi:hypothetical protein [Candidatus Nitrospira bockiana]